jgi:uncharacterized protein YbjT (DUF2867 family)
LIAELSDTPRLDEQMARAHAVVCLVGTMRSRFRAGDTYESSDYRPVVQLLESAKKSPLGEPRHFVLLTALGARPGSGYLGWKHRAEEAVRGSGLPSTILRPSFLDTRGSRSHPSHGTDRKPPPVVGTTLELLGKLPALRGVSDDLRPLPVDVLCLAIARIVRERGPLGTLKGRHIWELGLNPPAQTAAAS